MPISTSFSSNDISSDSSLPKVLVAPAEFSLGDLLGFEAGKVHAKEDDDLSESGGSDDGLYGHLDNDQLDGGYGKDWLYGGEGDEELMIG
jgi:Ca2+-binding RTX toxin-like protein